VKKIRIETGSRLHFGLLDLCGDLGRVDGGVGVALRRPRLVMEATLSTSVRANRRPELAAHAIDTINEHYGTRGGLDISVLEDYPSHVGLGSSTQFLLAVGTAYCSLKGIKRSARELATVLGRAGTSGIGLGVFESGGLIVDGGHSYGPGRDKQAFLPSRASPAPPAPVIVRVPIPKDWLFDVIVLETPDTVSGRAEIDFFSRHCPVDPAETGTLARVILSLILPGAVSHDIETFVRGINLIGTLGFKRHEIDNQFNNVKSTINNLSNITQKSFGVGMSSFGPTVFVISHTKDRHRYEEQLHSVISTAIADHEGIHVLTTARNTGASMSYHYDASGN
jgi:beta-ribofuranosylaminobenzene 5'-phosphate synthase